MARSILVGAFACSVLLLSTISRSDQLQGSGSAIGGSGSAEVLVGGMNIGQTDPGPNPWHYADLKPVDKAYVDRASDTTGWDQVNAAYASAAAERARAAAAQAAAEQLGVDSLGSEGVVP